MFTIPRVNVIESNEGFTVEVLSPTQVSYSEGNKVVIVSSEYLEGPQGLVIYTRSITNWNDGREITGTDRACVVENIRKAFRYRAIEIQVM